MMKPRLIFWTVSLIAAIGLSSCASAVTSPPAAPAEAATSAPTQVVDVAAPPSRGPNLEATDPTTVSLASGQLQLVEFFRFT